MKDDVVDGLIPLGAGGVDGVLLEVVTGLEEVGERAAAERASRSPGDR